MTRGYWSANSETARIRFRCFLMQSECFRLPGTPDLVLVHYKISFIWSLVKRVIWQFGFITEIFNLFRYHACSQVVGNRVCFLLLTMNPFF